MFRLSISQSWSGVRRALDNNYDAWAQILTVYTTAKLSFYNDTLIALSALAKEWSVILKGEYVVGLWKNDLARQLVWRACGELTRLLPYRATTLVVGCQWFT